MYVPYKLQIAHFFVINMYSIHVALESLVDTTGLVGRKYFFNKITEAICIRYMGPRIFRNYIYGYLTKCIEIFSVVCSSVSKSWTINWNGTLRFLLVTFWYGLYMYAFSLYLLLLNHCLDQRTENCFLKRTCLTPQPPPPTPTSSPQMWVPQSEKPRTCKLFYVIS